MYMEMNRVPIERNLALLNSLYFFTFNFANVTSFCTDSRKFRWTVVLAITTTRTFSTGRKAVSPTMAVGIQIHVDAAQSGVYLLLDLLPPSLSLSLSLLQARFSPPGYWESSKYGSQASR